MAFVVTIGDQQIIQNNSGAKKRVIGTMAFDNSYATNGEVLLNSQLGLDTVNQMAVYPSAGYVFEYIQSTGKVKAYYVPTGTNAAAAALGEVAANTNLAALNLVAFEAFGS